MPFYLTFYSGICSIYSDMPFCHSIFYLTFYSGSLSGILTGISFILTFSYMGTAGSQPRAPDLSGQDLQPPDRTKL